MKREIVIVALAVIAVLASLMLPQSKAVEKECPGCVCSCKEKQENITNVYYNYTTINTPELPQAFRIAQNMAEEHSYDKDLYDCETYSAELVRRYQDSGYEAHVCQGDLGFEGGQQSGHRWVKVCVYIEPQTGEVLEPHRLKEDYHLGGCG